MTVCPALLAGPVIDVSSPMSTTASRPPRLRLSIQPLIVKVYKVAGIVALGAILLGLILYLVNNVFYFFDNSWVRPVILSPNNERVMQASSELSTAEQRLTQLEVDRARATAEIARLGRVVAASDKFVADMRPVVEAAGKTVAAVVPRRELDRAELDRAAAIDDQQTVDAHLRELDQSIADQKGVIMRLSSSYYLKGRGGTVAVGFVPYENLDNARPGTPLYRCRWGLLGCSEVGKVRSVLEGEVSERHPHKDTVLRGLMLELELDERTAGESNVLFAGSRPFWLF